MRYNFENMVRQKKNARYPYLAFTLKQQKKLNNNHYHILKPTDTTSDRPSDDQIPGPG